MRFHPAIHKTIFLETIDSTNLEIHRQRDSYKGLNVLLISNEQTAGKGQHGRRWESKAGMGLWMSLFLGDPSFLKHDLKLLSLYTGLVLQRSLQNYLESELQLKWPNDLVIHSKKCAGVLTEIQWQGESASSAIIGIGINIHHKETDFPPLLQEIATSLRLEGSSLLDRDPIVEHILDDFFLNLGDLDRGEKLVGEWNLHAFRLNEMVVWDTGLKTVSGQFKGINESGEACLSVDGHRKYLKNGEFRLQL